MRVFKIDREKWLAAVAAVNEFRVARAAVWAPLLRGERSWQEVFSDPAARPYVYADTTAEQLTRLYSVRAMARGRVHRKRARVGGVVVDLGWEDQLRYVGETWKCYEAQDTVAQVLLAGVKAPLL